MLAFWFVEYLGLVEHILSGFGPGLVGSAPHPFSLEQIEEALGNGVVVAIPASAYCVLQIVMLQEGRPVHASEQGAMIRMDQHFGLWFSSLHGFEQRLQKNVCRLTALHSPTNDSTRVEIDHCRQICEAFLRSEIGDVPCPNPIWLFHIKLPV